MIGHVDLRSHEHVVADVQFEGAADVNGIAAADAFADGEPRGEVLSTVAFHGFEP